MPRRLLLLPLLLVAIAVSGCGSSSHTKSTSAAAKATPTTTGTSSTADTSSTAAATTTTPSDKVEIGFENVPLEQGKQIAPASTTQYAPVDGIQCAPIEQLQYHIHAHLMVYDDGEPRSLPAGIGIPGSRVEDYPGYGPIAVPGKCYYWLHTHTSDGIIHIESPTKRIYTLGEFFDEWHQPLTSTQIGTIKGPQVWTVNGKPWKKNPRDIPLTPHATIQLSVGQPTVPFQTVDWAKTKL